MIPIFTNKEPICNFNSIEICECILKGSENYYPVIIDGEQYFFFKNNAGHWYADGLSEDICAFLDIIIRDHETE